MEGRCVSPSEGEARGKRGLLPLPAERARARAGGKPARCFCPDFGGLAERPSLSRLCGAAVGKVEVQCQRTVGLIDGGLCWADGGLRWADRSLRCGVG